MINHVRHLTNIFYFLGILILLKGKNINLELKCLERKPVFPNIMQCQCKKLQSRVQLGYWEFLRFKKIKGSKKMHSFLVLHKYTLAIGLIYRELGYLCQHNWFTIYIYIQTRILHENHNFNIISIYSSFFLCFEFIIFFSRLIKLMCCNE